jgi:ureidoacrylate peracid hydrolase
MRQSHSITIDARHAPVTTDVSRTAVIVVDMQNDFAAIGGMFDRAGIDISVIRDTWNTAIINEVTPHSDDLIVWKHRFSGFFETALHDLLRAEEIDTLLFVGATTSICVESTVRDAMYRDYHCLIIEDCVAEPIGYDLPRSNHDASLLTLQILFGSITNSTAVHAALATLVPAG